MLELSLGACVSGGVVLLTFIGIFTEQFHGIERAKFAMAGAGFMIIVGQYFEFYSPELALEAIDWNVIFLLVIMMILVSIISTTGGFEYVAISLARECNGSQFALLLLLGALISLFSLMLDNVTAVIIFGPLIIFICKTQEVSPIPYLIASALLSNTAGTATLIGDPPNMMIGSAANIDFNTFLAHMGPPVLMAWCCVLLCMWWLFRGDLNKHLHHHIKLLIRIRNKKLWYKSLVVLSLLLILFLIHHHIEWEPWLVAAACLTLLVFWSRRVELDEATEHIETPLLMFFISLFIVVGGIEASGLLQGFGEYLKPLIIEQPLIAALCILWAAAILSALIDNIPFTATMIPMLLGLQDDGVNVSVMWWALAMGVGVGGNGSHVGSTANIYMVTLSERLARDQKQSDLAITPALWFKKGLPTMFVSLLLCSFYILFFYKTLFIED